MIKHSKISLVMLLSITIFKILPSKQLKLNLNNINDIAALKEEAKSLNNNITLHLVSHHIHFSITIVLILLICVICIICYLLRNRIIKYFKKKNDVTELVTFPNLVETNQLNEDVLA